VGLFFGPCAFELPTGAGGGGRMPATELGFPKCPTQFFVHPGRVWIGLDSLRNWKGCSYFDVPEQFKPSPLKFIFYDLRDSGRQLEKERIRFDALVFDAY